MSTRDFRQGTPSLFEAPPSAPVPAPEPARQPDEEKSTSRLARDFVRWCWSFGAEFRNSPDVTNLRYWIHKHKLKIKHREEAEILQSARMLFLRRIELLIKKSARS